MNDTAESRPRTWREVAGWLAVAFYSVAALLLAGWGIRDGLRYGWYHDSLSLNLQALIVPRLIPVFVLVTLGLVSLRWSPLGLGVHVVLAVVVVVIGGIADLLLPAVALSAAIVGLGWLFFTREGPSGRWSAAALVGLPLAALVGSGIGPAIRVATRISDDEPAARRVNGNGLTLVWAPPGPGWPDLGYNPGWSESLGICRFLSSDGRRLGVDLVDAWRLPAVEEVVRSLSRHERNSGGVWDEASGRARYEVSPDKEPPLWHSRAPVATWWTSTEVDRERAYTVRFDGRVARRDKNLTSAAVAYRCVRDPAGS